MVHALKEVQRILRNDGVLIDMRPDVTNPAVEVLSGESISIAGHLDDSADLPDVLAADQAMETALDRGWFQPLEQGSFSLAYYWDTPEEVLKHIQDNWPEVLLSDEVYAQAKQLADAAGPDCKLRIQFPMMIKSYRKVK